MPALLRRRFVVPVVVATVVAGSAAAWALSRHSAAASTTTASAATLVAVSRGTMAETVATSGTLQPAQQQTLSFQVSGTVTAVPARVGEAVGKGAVLAEVDSTALRSAVTSASAGVLAAQQQLAALSSPTAVQLTAAQAGLAQAQATLAQAQANLAAASLTAPFAGTVAIVGIAVGDSVGSGSAARTSSGTAANGGGAGSANTTSGSGTESITLISTRAWQVQAAVGSSDLAQLKVGQQAVITPSGSRTPVFGTVSTIGIVATTTSGGTAAFPVVIDVTGDPPGLFSGGPVTAVITVRQLSNVLIVPTAAVHQSGNATVVYVHVSGKRVVTPITVGPSYGPQTEVLSGLTDGAQVEVQGGRFGTRGGTRTGGGLGGGGGGFGGGGAAGGGAAGGGGGFGGGGFGGGTGFGGAGG